MDERVDEKQISGCISELSIEYVFLLLRIRVA